jgi:hypothetical protein
MSGQAAQRVEKVVPRFRWDGALYRANREVEYVKCGDYEKNILMLDDFVICGRDVDKWICIDRANEHIYSAEHIISVIYAYYGGKVRRVVEYDDKIVAETEEYGKVEFSDVL